jgi:hypothetical protein
MRTTANVNRRRSWLRVAVLLGCVTHAAASLADAPPGRYGVSAGIVKDNRTGLSWQQNIDASSYNWANAKTYCQALTLNGSGWRLPTYTERLTLVDPTRASPNPLIDANAFPSPPLDSFWTATRTLALLVTRGS